MPGSMPQYSNPGHRIQHALNPKHHIWVQVVKGRLTVNGEILDTGDGAALETADELVLIGIESSELLVFDLG